MINYNKNELINTCLDEYYETFRHTLDTCDYVPAQFNIKILKYIFKNMKRQFKKLDREDRKYQRQLRKSNKKKWSIFRRANIAETVENDSIENKE